MAGGIGGLAVGGLNAAGIGDSVLKGGANDALRNFAGNSMESINNLVGSEIYAPGRINAAKAGGGVEYNPTIKVDDSVTSGVKEIDTTPIETAPSPGTIETAPGVKVNEVGGVAGNAGTVPKDKGIIGGALDFVNNNKGLTEIVAKGVQGAAEASMGPDQQAYYDAAAKRIGVETDILTTQDEVAKYQAANMQNQVLMITAGDPTAEQQMADAKAKGYKVAIIPAIGTGYQPPSTNMQPAGEPVQAAFPATA
jgi:hypothetical protein